MTTMQNAGRDRSRAQALVEFALIIPIFLLIVITLFDFGRAVFAYTSVTNAAREGARMAIVNQGATAIQQRAFSQTSIAETDAPNLTVAFRQDTPNADYLTNAVCTTIELDCVAIVTFETTYRPITPLVSNILFPSGVTLRSTAIQRVEYVCPNALIATSAGCPKQP